MRISEIIIELKTDLFSFHYKLLIQTVYNHKEPSDLDQIMMRIIFIYIIPRWSKPEIMLANTRWVSK